MDVHLALLLLYSIVEMLSFLPYVNRISSSRCRKTSSVLLYAFGTGMHFLITYFLSERQNHWYFTVLLMLILAAAIYMIRRVGITEAVGHSVMIALPTRYLRHTQGDISILLGFGTTHVGGENILLRCALLLLLLILNPLMLKGIGRYTLQEHARNDARSMSALVVFSLVILALSDIVVRLIRFYANKTLPFAYGIAALTLFEFICLASSVLFIMYNEIYNKDAKTKADVEKLHYVMRAQTKQYESWQETRRMLDIRYHDLKSHLQALGAMKNDEARNRYIRQLQNDLGHYESFSNTGNSILDAVLNDKLAKCASENIRLLLMIDSAGISFLEPVDIVSIFGNALDNAIESAANGRDASQREIMARTFQRQEYVMIRFENYSRCPPVKKEGRPVSTKEGGEEHGIGLKSIEYTAEKYRGHASYTCENNRFVMNVMLQKPQESAAAGFPGKTKDGVSGDA